MQEEEWLACTRPEPMLRFLMGTDYPRVQDIESASACWCSAPRRASPNGARSVSEGAKLPSLARRANER
jgi:hypothetical protein